MQQLREPRLQLLFAKEALRGRLAAALAASRIAAAAAASPPPATTATTACPRTATAAQSARSVRSSTRRSQGHLTLLWDVPVNRLMLNFCREAARINDRGPRFVPRNFQASTTIIGRPDRLHHPQPLWNSPPTSVEWRGRSCPPHRGPRIAYSERQATHGIHDGRQSGVEERSRTD